ncbi:hypothetical protein L1285_03020 [Pseudoalteromonas sp. DL2-H2.2]|uniref:hypothetical protein n=1 Tax=Pseudoalteromonas sp. DL2-H2.2 TaxID=2908889 RepID=UPI001F34D102|nr:hypothetical protein [Pseudoalteromonas sp. DL2-H2.2]MCF2907311.1 hypothetical protein [Pseudoalteromonas sp. DL2-H2.2]
MTLPQLFTALVPFFSVFVLLVLLRLPAKQAMPFSLLVTSLSAYFIWQVPLGHITAASVVGLQGKEGDIIRYTLIPMRYYCLATVCLVRPGRKRVRQCFPRLLAF